MTLGMYCVQKEELSQAWSVIGPMIERACIASGSEMAGVHVHQRIMSGDFQCYVITDGSGVKCVVVTEIIQYPLKNFIRIVLLEGKDMRMWGEYLRDCLLAWAKELGGYGIEAECRPGFARALKFTGARMKRVVMEIQATS